MVFNQTIGGMLLLELTFEGLDRELHMEKHLHVFGAVDQYRAGAERDGLPKSGLFGPVRILAAEKKDLGH